MDEVVQVLLLPIYYIRPFTYGPVLDSVNRWWPAVPGVLNEAQQRALNNRYLRVHRYEHAFRSLWHWGRGWRAEIVSEDRKFNDWQGQAPEAHFYLSSPIPINWREGWLTDLINRQLYRPRSDQPGDECALGEYLFYVREPVERRQLAELPFRRVQMARNLVRMFLQSLLVVNSHDYSLIEVELSRVQQLTLNFIRRIFFPSPMAQEHFDAALQDRLTLHWREWEVNINDIVRQKQWSWRSTVTYGLFRVLLPVVAFLLAGKDLYDYYTRDELTLFWCVFGVVTFSFVCLCLLLVRKSYLHSARYGWMYQSWFQSAVRLLCALDLALYHVYRHSGRPMAPAQFVGYVDAVEAATTLDTGEYARTHNDRQRTGKELHPIARAFWPLLHSVPESLWRYRAVHAVNGQIAPFPPEPHVKVFILRPLHPEDLHSRMHRERFARQSLEYCKMLLQVDLLNFDDLMMGLYDRYNECLEFAATTFYKPLERAAFYSELYNTFLYDRSLWEETEKHFWRNHGAWPWKMLTFAAERVGLPLLVVVVSGFSIFSETQQEDTWVLWAASVYFCLYGLMQLAFSAVDSVSTYHRFTRNRDLWTRRVLRLAYIYELVLRKAETLSEERARAPRAGP